MDKWTVSRMIQLLVGIAFITDYMVGKTTFSLVFGGMMFFQAVLNIGCFSSKGCSVPSQKNVKIESESKDVEYELVQ